MQMKAVCYEEIGEANKVLKEITIEVPTPGAEEVLVKLFFSGVNPSDVKSRSGNRPGSQKLPYQRIIPHSDGSGIITAVGKNVSQSRIGKRVWIWNGQWQRPFGTMAEYIALPSNQAINLPEYISLEAGAALGIPGLTAVHCTLGSENIKDKTVLISGGSGAVGHIALQLAKWAGATVIATGSPRNHGQMKKLGADFTLDYRSENLQHEILDVCPEGIDRAIELEFGKNVNLLGAVLRPEGTISVYGSAKEMMPKIPFGTYLFKAINIDISLIYILGWAKRSKAIDLLNLAFSDGAIVLNIDKTYNFSECALAHENVEKSGRIGATLVKITR